MCTAINIAGEYSFFGRTLDLECSFGEEAVSLSSDFSFSFRYEGEVCRHYSILGIAHFEGAAPLFYDGMNEKGLCVAALNFPGNAVYRPYAKGKLNLASFEVIPYLLCKCKDVSEARDILKDVNITDDVYSEKLRATPLHWIVADRIQSITIEPLNEGVAIYDNPFGVLTNNPPFPYHMLRACEHLGLSPATRVNSFYPEAELKPFSRGSGAIGLPGDWSSPSRFIRAAFVKAHLQPLSHRLTHLDVFRITDAVAVPKGAALTDKGEPIATVYACCADREDGRYYFQTYGEREPRFISFEDTKDNLCVRV